MDCVTAGIRESLKVRDWYRGRTRDAREGAVAPSRTDHMPKTGLPSLPFTVFHSSWIRPTTLSGSGT